MVDSFCYPKRCIQVEPFGNQIDVIEKTLIEIENQPPRHYTYTNQNTRRHNTVPYKHIMPTNQPQLTSTVPNVFGNISSEMARNGYSEGYQPMPSVSQTPASTLAKQPSSPKIVSNSLVYATFDPFQPTDFKTDTQLASGPLSGYVSGSLSSTATSSSIWGNNDSNRSLNDATVWG